MASCGLDVPTDCIEVTIKRANLVCTYEHPEISLLECPVCKLHLIERCLDCRVNNKTEEECQAVRGGCEHVFHDHCIRNWCSQHRECPACFKEWTPVGYVDRA